MNKLHRLTKYQLSILILLADGYTDASIAEAIGKPTTAIVSCIGRIFDRLDLRDPSLKTSPRVKAAVYYIQHHRALTKSAKATDFPKGSNQLRAETNEAKATSISDCVAPTLSDTEHVSPP